MWGGLVDNLSWWKGIRNWIFFQLNCFNPTSIVLANRPIIMNTENEVGRFKNRSTFSLQNINVWWSIFQTAIDISINGNVDCILSTTEHHFIEWDLKGRNKFIIISIVVSALLPQRCDVGGGGIGGGRRTEGTKQSDSRVTYRYSCFHRELQQIIMLFKQWRNRCVYHTTVVCLLIKQHVLYCLVFTEVRENEYYLNVMQFTFANTVKYLRWFHCRYSFLEDRVSLICFMLSRR